MSQRTEEIKNKFYKQIHYPIVELLKPYEGTDRANRNAVKMQEYELEDIASCLVHTAAVIMDTLQYGTGRINTTAPNEPGYRQYAKTYQHKLRKAIGHSY